MPQSNELSFPVLSRESPRPWEHRRWRDPSPPPRPSSRASVPDPEVRRVRSRSLLSSRPPSPVPTIIALEDDPVTAEAEAGFEIIDRLPPRGRRRAPTLATDRSSSPDAKYSLGGFAPGRMFGAAVNDRRSGNGKCWEIVEIPIPDGDEQPSSQTLRRACAGCPTCLRPSPYPLSSAAAAAASTKRSRSAVSVRGAARSPRVSQAGSPLASPSLDGPGTASPRLSRVRERLVAAFRERSRSISSVGV